MNCPHCNAENDTDNVFCVSCGETVAAKKNLAATTLPPPTEYYHVDQMPSREDAPESVQTLYKPAPQFSSSNSSFNSSIPFQPTHSAEPKSRIVLWLGLALFLLIGAAAGGYFLLKNQTPATTAVESLPDHLGMFVQSQDKSNLSEISRLDFGSAVQARDDLLKNESLPVAADKPNLLLFYDSKEVPLGDLKLVPIDSIKDDGNLKQLNYQAAPVEGKPEIKRLRVPDGLANGKYAFALFDGFLDEGKHKFWAFQVKNAPKTDNGELAKAFSLSLKPKANNAPQNTNSTVSVAGAIAKPSPIAPAGAQVAYCKSSNIVLRTSPSLTAKKVNALKRGQKIYIINYSENYDYWNGMEGNWAYIQTESGNRGWVFSPLIGSE